MPQSLCTSTSHSPLLLKTLVDPVLVTIPPKLIDNLSFKLGNVSDDILSEMEVDQIQILLMDADGIISSAALNPSVFFQPSNFFSIPQSLSLQVPTSSFTPKMDRVRFIAPSAGVITFT